MAAKVAAVAGLVAAGAAQAQAAAPQTGEVAHESATAGERVVDAAVLAEKVRFGGAKGCGCAPCWGPPAPPAMDWLEAA